LRDRRPCCFKKKKKKAKGKRIAASKATSNVKFFPVAEWELIQLPKHASSKRELQCLRQLQNDKNADKNLIQGERG